MNQIASKLAGSVRQAKEQTAQDATQATEAVAKSAAKAAPAKKDVEAPLPKFESRRCWPD